MNIRLKIVELSFILSGLLFAFSLGCNQSHPPQKPGNATAAKSSDDSQPSKPANDPDPIEEGADDDLDWSDTGNSEINDETEEDTTRTTGSEGDYSGYIAQLQGLPKTMTMAQIRPFYGDIDSAKALLGEENFDKQTVADLLEALENYK